LGLVTNTGASWLTWQGLLARTNPPLGGKTGKWAYANLGVFAALVLSFLVTVAFTSDSFADKKRPLRRRYPSRRHSLLQVGRRRKSIVTRTIGRRRRTWVR